MEKKFSTKKMLLAVFTTKRGLITLTALVVCGMLAWYGVKKFARPNTYQLALDNVAEARFYMKTAETNPIASVQFYSGMREDPYEQNGIANTTKAFAVISVDPVDDKVGLLKEIPAEIIINGTATPITLTKNPYGSNFAADLEKLVDVNSTVQLTLKYDTGNPATFDLQNIMGNGAIGWEKALEIATGTLPETIMKAKNVETYVKIVCDKTTVNMPFWYVSFVTDTKETFFVIVAPDGKIVGKTEK
jgi:hypothetical protein